MRLRACLPVVLTASVLSFAQAMASGSPASDMSKRRSARADECDTLFRSVVTYSSTSGTDYTHGVAAGDFDGDGNIDLATTNYAWVTVRAGRGDGTFAPGVKYPVPDGAQPIVTADFNGDGIADLATTGPGTVSVLLGLGTPGHPQGAFAVPVVSSPGGPSGSMATGDFNHDGIVDLAVNYNGFFIGSGVSILIGRGDGSFATELKYPLEYFTACVATGDFDADGITDLAVALSQPNGRIAILRGRGRGGVGDGTFSAPAFFPVGMYPRGISVGDFNADGILDLAVAMDAYAAPTGLNVLLGQGSGRRGDGTFGPPISYLDATFQSSAANVGQAVVAGDFDGDRITDLAVTEWRPGGITLLHGVRGGGHDGRFEPLGWAGLLQPFDMAAADFDGDGLLDIAAANWGGFLSVLLTHDRTGGPVHHPPGWARDGLAVCTALGDQTAPVAIPDGAGGAFVAWTDGRMGAGTAYVQRVRGNGVPMWATDGLPMCAEQGPTGPGALAIDGKGGAWIGWAGRGVHLQHLTPAGEFDLSPCPGIEVSPDDAFGITLAADGSGGVYVTYIATYSSSYETSYSLTCQHLTAAGTPAAGWPAKEGVVIGGANDDQDSITRSRLKSSRTSSDGAGGVVLSWDTSWDTEDGDGFGAYSSLVRLAADGAELYRVTYGRIGVGIGDVEASAVSTADADGSQVLVRRMPLLPMSDDGSRVEVQRIGPTGAVAWSTSLCTASGARHLVSVLPLKGGGASAVWTDSRSGDSDIYAGRVTADGQLASGWPVDGARVCVASGDQVQPTALALADGRLLTCWADGRGAGDDIYGMLLRADGTPDRDYPAVGRPICAAPDAQTSPVVVEGDGGAAIIVWQDHRCGNWDIYAQKVQIAGPVARRDAASDGDTAPRFSLGGAWPNPARGRLSVTFTLPNPGPARLEVLDVAGRKVLERELRGMSAGPHVVDLGEDGALAPGIYAVRVHAGGEVLSKMVVLTR